MSDQRNSDTELSRRDIPSFIEPRPPLIQNPFMRPRPQKGTNLLELFEEDSEIEEPESVQVYLRVKPCDVRSDLYEIRSDKCLVTTLDTTTAGHGRRTQHNLPKMYMFSKIFRPDSSQREIFEHVVKDNLKKLPDGHSFTLLTYGASGSGKTYTLMGTVMNPGLLPRSLEYVFKLVDAAQQPTYKPIDGLPNKLSYDEQDFELQWVKRLRHVSAPLREKYRRMSSQLHNNLTESHFDLTNGTKHYVWVSFVEIYNEAIYDLLAPPDKRTKLLIREDTSGNVYVKGATQAFVRSGEEAYDVLVAGKHNLVVAATGVHAQSSRSHCIFTITMLTETEGSVRLSCVRLCDLAGSERARATRNTGARMHESRNINNSLLVLQRCLHMLRRNQRHNTTHSRVPYRESKLTRLLGGGLCGARGEALSMVVTINPTPKYAHETRHVLTLATVAQDIQINSTMYTTTLETSESSDSTVCTSDEIMKLRADNELLQFELTQAEARIKKLLATIEEKQEQAAQDMKEYVKEAQDIAKQYYEGQIEALRAEMDDLIDDYERRLAEVPLGTPSKHNSQNKITQLMAENADLEKNLSEERLARIRAEKEVERLRSIIRERDETEYTQKETTPTPDDELDLDSDEDISDPFNESLEPTFKKEGHQISIAVSKQDTSRNNDTYSDKSDDDTINEKSISDNDQSINSVKYKSNDTIKCDSLNVLNDSVNVNDSVNSKLDENSIRNNKVEDNDSALDDSSKNDNDSALADSLKIDEVKNEDELAEDINNDISNPNNAKPYFNIDKSPLICKDKSNYINSTKSPLTEDIKTVDTRGTYFVQDSKFNEKPKVDLQRDENRPDQFSDTLVSRIIKSIKSAASSDTSLRQFEQLEQAANHIEEHNETNSFGNIKIIEKRKYFDGISVEKKDIEEDKQEIVIDEFKSDISNNSTKKRTEIHTYFDDKEPVQNQAINYIKVNARNEDRSPSIVKDDVVDFEPTTIKQLLGENVNKNEILTSITKHNILGKKHDSLDPFDGFDSPRIENKDIINIKEISNVDAVRNSIEKLVLEQKTRSEVKKDKGSPVEDPVNDKSGEKEKIDQEDPDDKEKIKTKQDEANIQIKIEKTDSVDLETDKEQNDTQNTIVEFENLYKKLSTHRPTEFDLLTQELSSNEIKTDRTDEIKYNLRHKGKSVLNTSEEKKGEVLIESKFKCEAKTKRSLRLRRRKNVDDDNSETDNEKLKDILNLKKEFCDVTLGLPAVKKDLKDIPSPENKDEENLPPLMGIQSCPSKSVTRSRRKLFTPRAEPLEESLTQGESNERVRVPRPSYHRGRARRKL